jgi:K(+)-stimulated pyrophosphate-energized sodium pump
MEVTSLNLSGVNLTFVAVVGVIALIALVMAMIFRREVLAANDGTPNMQSIARAVQEGASAYLGRQFRTLSIFAVAAFFLLLLLPVHSSAEFSSLTLRISRSVAFLAGAVFSALIGFLGMWLAVRANVRVASAARSEGRDPAMKIAFRTGAHVGMATVGLGLFGASLVVFIFRGDAPTILEGFGFGAAMLAMFMRVGGGIFTKAADVGADLVGKVEKNIPEDDPRNAATIADNVGDNVGDCAGMAADSFESYAVTLVASLILGKAAFGEYGLVFPLIVPAIGVITAIIGVFLTRPRAGENGLKTINRSFYYFCRHLCGTRSDRCLRLPAVVLRRTQRARCRAGRHRRSRIVAIGRLRSGSCLRFSSSADRVLHRHRGSSRQQCRQDLVDRSSDRGARRHLGRAGVGGLHRHRHCSCCLRRVPARRLGCCRPVRHRTRRLRAAHHRRCHRGDGYLRPVSDNAQGIAEMSGEVHGAGSRALTELDAVGNTTKAITKGIAIATAVLAATALFGSYTDAVHIVLAEGYGQVHRAGPWSSRRRLWLVCCLAPLSSSCSPVWRSAPSGVLPAPWFSR